MNDQQNSADAFLRDFIEWSTYVAMHATMPISRMAIAEFGKRARALVYGEEGGGFGAFQKQGR